MKILSLEFSSRQRSVAVSESADGTCKSLFVVSEEDKKRTPGIALIDRALFHAKIDRRQIQLLALGLGPGSNAGIRSAISLGQGWQLGTTITVLGFDTMDIIAYEALKTGIRGDVSIVVDAQRDEVYESVYSLSDEQVSKVQPLKIIGADQIPATRTVVGPDARKFRSDGIEIWPNADALSLLVSISRNLATRDPVEPIFLRDTMFVKAPPARIIEIS